MDDPGSITGTGGTPAGGPAASGALVLDDEADRPGSSRTRALARAGIIVTVLFLASRVLGYVRYVVIANAVPEIAQLDAFLAAFRIPDFLFQLVAAGALSSALIPVIAGLFATEQEARAWRVVSTVTTLMLSVLLVLTAVVLVLAPELITLITPGFDAAQVARTTELTRVMVLSPLFLAAGAVATSVLNARGRFGAAALAPLVYNASIIVGALVLVPLLGINGLAISVVIGAAGHVLVQLPVVVRVGARIRPRLDLGDAEARKALILMAPRAIGLGSTQIVFVVMTGLASTVGDGGIAVFNFAFAVLQIPVGVIGVPLGVVLLPSLSREAALGATETFRRLLVRGLTMLGYVMLATAALGIVVAEDVTRLLFDYGSINEEALELTAATLGVFLVGLTAHALIAVLARAFYAMQDTATPVAAALLAVAVNIAAALILVGPLGVAGLAAAIAIGAWVELVTLVLLLRRRVPGLGFRHVAAVMARSVLAAAAGGAVAWLAHAALLGLWGEDPGFVLLLVRAAVSTVLGGVVILGASVALRIEELGTIVGIVVDLLRRKGRA
jgi:putative peptidoglycan lipid II flippase